MLSFKTQLWFRYFTGILIDRPHPIVAPARLSERKDVDSGGKNTETIRLFIHIGNVTHDENRD
jgi:hypothetical protein